MSAEVTPVSSHDRSSPTFQGIKAVLSNRRQSSEVHSDIAIPDTDLRASVTSLPIDKSPSRVSTRSSPSRDDASSKSGSSGVKKLIPGHSKRKRRREREEVLKAAAEDLDRGRSLTATQDSRTDLNRSTSSLGRDGANSLLTDDSEPDM